MKINFNKADISFKVVEPNVIRTWFVEVAKLYQKNIQSLEYIFCSDDFLHNINVEYLQHDEYTDIITFDLSEKLSAESIDGEIYVSLDRIADNANELKVSFQEEFYRVLIHGLLHLCGEKDKSEPEVNDMRKAETNALTILCSTWNIDKQGVKFKVSK